MPGRRMRWALVLTALIAGPGTSTRGGESTWRFDFGPGKVETGYVQVLPDMTFTAERGYGFEPGAQVEGIDRGGDDALRGDFCTAGKPFAFSIALPEGLYRVTVTLGDQDDASTTTLKAESRRL